MHGGPSRNPVRRHPGVKGFSRRMKIEALAEFVLERNAGRSKVFFECVQFIELAWNTLKDFLASRGSSEKLYGSEDATRAAFAAGLIEDGEAWMKMIAHRNESSHTYNDEVACKIAEAVRNLYVPAFAAFHRRLLDLEKKESA
jgi:nucleotidyltransferase substrate binding protein (TIGR01987 family)